METEKHIWEKCTNLNVKTLASVRSLIVNDSTSHETISSILQTLFATLLLQQQHHHHHYQENPLHHHVLKLLRDLSLCRKHLSPLIFNRVYTYVSVTKHASLLTAKAIALLSSSTIHYQELRECFFLLLCSSPSVSVRLWVLLNAKRFCVAPTPLVTVLLNFTTDPYPYVRRAALDGFVSLRDSINLKKRDLAESCYDCAVELLLDTNDCVRSVAVQAASEWGRTLATLDNESGQLGWFDAVFVQLCAMVRDMSVDVRIQAFASLGDMKLVSEDILLQTLSKKITKVSKEKKITGLCTSKAFDLPTSNVAGIFVHGLEDEFHEVRKSACMSLGKLTNLSVQFAKDALNLLMDMLNDDVMDVRLQCLQTMHHMATFDRMRVQQIHMHMFLSTLVDSNNMIRYATRKILRLMKLTDLHIFKSVTTALLTNLESYPEEETDIFNVLFNIGRNHGNFAVSFVMEVFEFEEIEPSSKGELHFDKSRVAAILVLAIAASLTHEQRICSIPTRIFNYAVPFLGRISHSIRDFISRDTLFAYLSHRSSIVGNIPNHDGKEIINKVGPLCQINYETSERLYQDDLWDPSHKMSIPEYQQKLTVNIKEETNAIGSVLRTVAETWWLLKSGHTDEVRRTLRSCKEELATISVESNGSVGLLAFARQYVLIIGLLGKVWMRFCLPRNFNVSRTLSLDLPLEKLDMNLRRMRYGFLGFSIDVELHILEFILLTCVLRLSKAEQCCRRTILKRLGATISCVQLLCEKGSIKLSDFSRELISYYQENSSEDGASYCSFDLKRLLEFFSLKQVVFAEKLKHVKAELDVPGNDSENPLPFISGLPAAITFQITVHNTSSEDRLWLKMAVEEIAQYVFLDFNQFEDSDCFRKVTLSVPFFRTPKATSFSLRACIGKECPAEDVELAKCLGGPKHELTFLCNDEEVYFVRRS